MTPRLLRMSGYIPVGIPITLFMVLANPTIRNTVFIQFVNQSYMAGLNFANKNETCPFTTLDLIKGYSIALGSSLSIAVGLRKISNRLSSGSMSVNRLLMLNTMVSLTASVVAGSLNTASMRQAEVNNGVDVYTSPDLSQESRVGTSKACAV